MGNRHRWEPSSRDSRGGWQSLHRLGMKGPEPGPLWPWGQGVCRQRCSPTIPADEIHGGTRRWGSQTDPGMLVAALEAWTYWGGFWHRDPQTLWVKAPATKPWAAKGQLSTHPWSQLTSQIPLEGSHWRCKFWCFSPFSIPLNILQPIQTTPHSDYQLPQHLFLGMFPYICWTSIPESRVSQLRVPQNTTTQFCDRSTRDCTGTTENHGAALETSPLLSSLQHQSGKPMCGVKAMHLSLRKALVVHLRSKPCISSSLDCRLW